MPEPEIEMPVTVTKSKPKAPVVKAAVQETTTAVEPSEMTPEQLADAYGSLQDKLEALRMNPLFAQFEEVAEEVKKRMEAYEKTDTVAFKGKHWIIEAGACAKAPRKITDPLAVANFLGAETFAKVAKVGVSDAEKYLTPDQFSKVVSEETYTSNRKITSKFLG